MQSERNKSNKNTTSHKIDLIPIKRNENDKMIDRLKGIETNNFT